jgi:hypothetical protein
MSEPIVLVTPTPGSSLESWSSLYNQLPLIRIGLFELEVLNSPYAPLKDWLLERKLGKLASSLSTKSMWLVIAIKDNGDPLIVSSLSSGEPGNFPVYAVDTECNSFEKLQVADTIENCAAILHRLNALSPERDNLQAYLEKPVPAKTWETFISETEVENPNSEAWFWTCDNDLLGEEADS